MEAGLRARLPAQPASNLRRDTVRVPLPPLAAWRAGTPALLNNTAAERMEIRPVITPGRPYIERYGPGGFKISGTIFAGAALILPDGARIWPISAMASTSPPAP